jgi:enoyl-CoA hydratase
MLHVHPSGLIKIQPRSAGTRGINLAYRHLLYEQDNGIAVVTINRPQALNALNNEAFAELYELFQEIEKDAAARVAIITGSGEKSFIAGTDITDMVNLNPAEARVFAGNARKTCDYIYNLSKPVIAAVNGFALGGGCELAMCADLRIASENARFGQPEITLGIIPGSGGTQRLVRLIGIAKAKEMVYTGDMIDAGSALAMGMVNKVVPLADLMRAAKDLAGRILRNPGVALTLAKIAINSGENVDLSTGLDIELQCFAQCFATEDQKEGMKAFLEKRKPVYHNK